MATPPNEITIASPPTTVDVASQILASMAALNGAVTDYNPGSQVRTFAEATGAVSERQGIWDQALAFQALVYSAMSLYGIFPGQAVASSGVALFETSNTVTPAPPASQNVTIPAGTIVGTNGGVQFQTTVTALLANGSSGVSVPVTAVIGGTGGNIPAGALTQIVTPVGYPLFVTNASGFAGGANAETPSQALARFAAVSRAIGLSSPGAIANAAIGVIASGTGEVVKFSTCYEPWIVAGSGAASGQALWQLYIDNGLGGASSGLIAAVTQKLNGGIASGATNSGGSQVGYRDAGVPFDVLAVVPLYANVTVIATVNNLVSTSIVQQAISSAVSGYFTLPFGATAEQPQISAAAANSSIGLLTSLAVSLYASGAPSTPVSGLTPFPYGRVILNNLTVTVTAAP
jgi:hypothetical protein